ncbi:MAG: cell wall metabolism sensor histidine kinase WalK [Paenibacillaceae bacterium]
MKEIRFFQTIQFRLIMIYVLLILIAVQVIGVYFVRTLESSFLATSSENMTTQVGLMANFVEPYLASIKDGNDEEREQTYNDLDSFVKSLNTISNAEIQIIDANSKIVSTTTLKQRSIVGQKNTDTEVSRALQGVRNISGMAVDQAGNRLKVIAMPVGSNGKVIGAVYMVASMEDMYKSINRINRILFSGTIIALALTALLGIVLAHTITHPIKEITKQATAMADGDFNRQVKVLSQDEIGQLGSAFNNMTDRLKEALEQNEEEKEKLSSILSNMSDGVIATDDLGKVILMNLKATNMLKTGDLNELQANNMADLLGLPKDKVDRYVLGEENSVRFDLDRGVEDEPMRARVTFSPIHRRGMGITGTIAVLQDVTEQEKLEQARRDFVANVSHELRTPLTTIKSYMEALDDGALDDPTLSHKFIGVVRNETERMIRLVTDLLHLSKLDSKQASIVKEWTDVKQMLEEVADRFAFQLQQKSMSIEVLTEEPLDPVWVDPDQIDQVLDNLVFNAIKYTSDGGSIELRARRINNMLIELSVKDTGIGIPKRDIEYIFDRFYRVDKARSRVKGGTGLGLSIAREIIKAHGGVISIESEVNVGTLVKFTLLGSSRRDIS